jgi:hypothetical protein
MMIGVLVAGIGCLLAGFVAIGFGIPINEFGLGNTLILAGSVAACSGLIILSLCAAVRELKGVAGQPGSSRPADPKRDTSQPVALPRPTESASVAPHTDPFGGEASDGLPPSPPWVQDTGARDRPRHDAPSAPAPEAPAKPRRNLMFSSSRRERTAPRPGEEPAADLRPSAAADVDAMPPPAFEDAWRKSRPAEGPPQRHPARLPATPGEPAAPRQPPAMENQPTVTVLKSGVVDGMAYSLYSDGSIEAQMPEGMMRFASIDELRAHLDQRP